MYAAESTVAKINRQKIVTQKFFCAKIFDTKVVVAKINPQKLLWIYFCNIIFCITNVCITNICTSIFDSIETTHAEINVQYFVMQKKFMQNFFSQKNACKNKSSKIFDYLIRVHNDKGLELCGREGTCEWTFISQPNERSHKRASTLL